MSIDFPPVLEHLSLFLNALFSNKVVLTILLAFFILGVKYALVKTVRNRAISKGKDKRDLVNNIKNFINFVMLFLQ